MKTLFSKNIITVITTLVLSACAGANNCEPATVTYVDDGDTAKVTMQSDGSRKTIRFYGVDSPETKFSDRETGETVWPAQPFAYKAKDYMTNLIGGKKVCVRFTGASTYGRPVGEIFIGGQSASQLIVNNGLAWWNKKYAPNDKAIAHYEGKAKADRRGLWSQLNPEAPWSFRYRHRN